MAPLISSSSVGRERMSAKKVLLVHVILSSGGFPRCHSGKESACQCRQCRGLNPGLGRSPGGGNGNSLRYSCLQNPMDRGAWQVTYSLRGYKELETTEATERTPLSFRMDECNSQQLFSGGEAGPASNHHTARNVEDTGFYHRLPQ